jgi:hypothetical protein
MMRIPYVIDNVEHRLSDVLKPLLREQPRRELEIATAYFSIRGFEQLRETLPGVRCFRLLLGDRPVDGATSGGAGFPLRQDPRAGRIPSGTASTIRRRTMR